MGKRIIINADDCGMSVHVNECIEEAIKLGKISSTTILANMNDFEGAVRLYKEYSDQISFGWHINLDEGEPLTNSQYLLDKFFFVEKDNKIVMNGSQFRTSYLNSTMRKEIKNELRAQWEKIHDFGIKITHVDGHHYIHSQPSMIQVMPSLFHELRIDRCRHVANYGIKGLSGFMRSAWAVFFKINGIRMPDTFCSFSEYSNNCSLQQGETIELMCHPGHPSEAYKKEFECVKSVDISRWSAKLITYKDI